MLPTFSKAVHALCVRRRPWNWSVPLNKSLVTASARTFYGSRTKEQKSNSLVEVTTLDLEADFHKVTNVTLEKLSDFLTPLEDDDEVELEVSMGVLKLRLLSPLTSKFEKLRGQHISWVINKQTPNRQLWWSSPISGPRRYEWQPSNALPTKDGLQIVSNWKYTRAAAIPGAANGATQSSNNDSNNGSMNGSKSVGGKEELDLLQQLHSEVLAVTGVDLLVNSKQ